MNMYNQEWNRSLMPAGGGCGGGAPQGGQQGWVQGCPQGWQGQGGQQGGNWTQALCQMMWFPLTTMNAGATLLNSTMQGLQRLTNQSFQAAMMGPSCQVGGWGGMQAGGPGMQGTGGNPCCAGVMPGMLAMPAGMSPNLSGTSAGGMVVPVAAVPGGMAPMAYQEMTRGGAGGGISSRDTRFPDQDLSGEDEIKQVRYSIIFTKPDYEAQLQPEQQELLTYDSSVENFAAQRINEFLMRFFTGKVPPPPEWAGRNYPPAGVQGLPREDLRYVEFRFRVTERFDKRTPNYDRDQARATVEMRDAFFQLLRRLG